MIEFVTLENIDKFKGNPLAGQHRLRYKAIIERQNWSVPRYCEMEFDQYDNPAAKYLIYRDENNVVRGASRFYPTSMPYMLEQVFSQFVTTIPMPKADDVWEGSRFCIDPTLSPETRKRIAREIVVSYLEVALHHGIRGIVGLMYPAYWRNLFTSAGWDIEFIGELLALDDGHKTRAAWLPVSTAVLTKVRNVTGIYETVTIMSTLGMKDNEYVENVAA